MNEEQEVELVELARLSKTGDAGMIQELLENNGIDVIVQGASLTNLWPGGLSETVLLVKESDQARAQQLYDAFFEPQGGDDLAADTDVPKEPGELEEQSND
ncbi:MAG: DUF2007 domain-containing protein [Acidobacteriota bacterium]